MTFRVMVLGAGSGGIFVGGKLAAAGAEVTFVGGSAVLDEIIASGLRLTDLDGGADRVAATAFRTVVTPQEAETSDLVLVTVRSAATGAAAADLTDHVPPGTVVLSLQNGIGNDAVIREVLPSAVVLAGMVTFTVVNHGDGCFHRSTEGGLAVADDPALDRFAPLFRRAGLAVNRPADLLPIQWAELLAHLNDPINALSGLLLREELANRDYRRCLALAQWEALAVMRRARIRPARLSPLPPQLTVRLLTMPDAVFTRIVGKVLTIDPMARSSMADDLALGRKTDIAWLCGEIVSLGAMVGLPTPVNRCLIELITAAENGESHGWSGPKLLSRLRAAGAGEQPAAAG